MNRIIVRLKRSGGLPVIAILTPIFLSIPVGCIASAIIYKDRKKVLTFMIVSVLLWTIVLFGARELFGLNLKELAN